MKDYHKLRGPRNSVVSSDRELMSRLVQHELAVSFEAEFD